jgi:hypothetical protein
MIMITITIIPTGTDMMATIPEITAATIITTNRSQDHSAEIRSSTVSSSRKWSDLREIRR